jgi:[protein-PII] uridylyltransferase
VWNGWKAQLIRTLYYETEPVLTGGFSEVNRAQRIEVAQAEFRATFKEWPEAELEAYIARHYPAYWLKVELPRKIRHARFVKASEAGGHKLAVNVGFDEGRGVTELTIMAPDHPWLLSIIAGACASAGANIVDAQIYTTTDGLRSTPSPSPASTTATMTKAAAQRVLAIPSSRFWKASCGCQTSWHAARRRKLG